MKKFFTIFFMTLGVIFFILILCGAYFFIADPLNLKPLLFEADTELNSTKESEAVSDKNPVLNETQERALEAVGIDPANVPTQITKEQEACFVEKLGQARVDEIVGGDSPTASEVFKARGCI